MEPNIYFVATPIGNLKDITLRALEVLRGADVIFCEDTRHSLKLLSAYDIKKPLYSCHKFNEREAAEKIIANAKEGKRVAIISDAGMPVISDPGNTVCKSLKEAGVEYRGAGRKARGIRSYSGGRAGNGKPLEQFKRAGAYTPLYGGGNGQKRRRKAGGEGQRDFQIGNV